MMASLTQLRCWLLEVTKHLSEQLQKLRTTTYMNAKKHLVVKFAMLATLHVCQACLPCIHRLHAVLLAAMAKAPATFFIAVSKVSFDA